MFYKNSLRKIRIGDKLIADGVCGLVVCDYEEGLVLPSYEELLTQEQLADGTYFSTGIMVESEKYGLVYYSEPDDEITPA